MFLRPPSTVVVAAGRARSAHSSARRLRLPLHAASKGFGASSSKSPPPPPSKKHKPDGGGGKKGDAGTSSSSARVKTADPEVQRSATLLLTALVAETDPVKRAKIAAENTDKIDGVFFAVADAYIKLARGEAAKNGSGDGGSGGSGGSGGGGEEVAAGLEAAVKCALDAKQATLRPEIRLLNQLLDAPSLEARRAVLTAENGAGGRLLQERASREYLNQLLDTFQKDVEAQARAATAAKGGDVSAVHGLKRAIEETRSIVLAAAAAAGGGGSGGGGKS